MFGNYGIFDGSGAEQHYEVKQLPLRHEGVPFEVNCDHCGRTQEILLEWSQISQAAAAPQTQQPPRDPVTNLPWMYDAQTKRMYPQIGCVQCRNQVGPSVSPDEAVKLLQQGVSSGLIRPRQ